METILSFGRCQPQLFLHNLLGGVVGQLEIVGAGHHAGQVVVGRHLGGVEGLLDDGEGRAEGLEPSDGEAGTPGDELEERSLVVLVVLRHNLEQVPHAVAVHGVAMVGLATITQHLK